MKKESRLTTAYGGNKYGLADVPHKLSSVMVSRIFNGDESGCSHCFPHGYETFNAKWQKQQRNWKSYRKNQWKVCRGAKGAGHQGEKNDSDYCSN